jgi:plastocyanin
LELGDVYTITFDEPGEYTYICVLHPPVLGAIAAGHEGEKLAGGGQGMKGTVIVE